MKFKQILREIDGVFKKPKKEYYLGKIKYGTPYFFPWYFHPTILSIRRLKLRSNLDRDEYLKKYPHLVNTNKSKFSNLPMVLRTKYWIKKIFNRYYFIKIGWPIKIKQIDLGYKEKYGTPRYEWSPSFQIYFFKWQFCIFWNSPISTYNDQYYEQILWYVHYADKDIYKAEETWGWVNSDGESTWNNNFLI